LAATTAPPSNADDGNEATSSVARLKRFVREYTLSKKFKAEMKKVIKDCLFRDYKFATSKQSEKIVAERGRVLFNVSEEKFAHVYRELESELKLAVTSLRISSYRAFQRIYLGE
jgi:hypothetical protein